jgi:predicted RNA-binding Zn-ribbon protein involved in translation (DUF1610 family)
MDFIKSLENIRGLELSLGCANTMKDPLIAAEDALEKQIPRPLLKKGSYTRACPRCGTLYGLSTSRARSDTQYCENCGQLMSGWNDAVRK